MISISLLRQRLEQSIQDALQGVIDERLFEMEQESKRRIEVFYAEQRFKCKELAKKLTLQMFADQGNEKISIEVRDLK